MTNSYYELHQSLSTPRLTRQKEWFSGSQLHDKWTLTETGTGTTAMNDVVDGGWKYITGSNANDNGIINFSNSVRHYDPTSSTCIFKATRGTATNALIDGGLSEDTSFTTFIIAQDDTADTFITLISDDGTSNVVDTAVAVSTDPHRYKIEGKTSSALLHVDGDLECISVTNLPTGKQCPQFRTFTRTTAPAAGIINYMEVYNI